jgi:hypothetical protein
MTLASSEGPAVLRDFRREASNHHRIERLVTLTVGSDNRRLEWIHPGWAIGDVDLIDQ